MSVEKVCRVCLSECNDLTPLWVQLPGENKTLEEAINFVTNINMRLEDGLPDKICKTCESVLDLADTFKQRCLESESILEQQAREKLSVESRPKYEKQQENNGTYSANSFKELTESADNIYDLPKHKIKIEIEETQSDQENLDTAEYEVPIEHCFIKEEFSESMKYPDNKETFSCPHCSLTFQTKLSYKVHIFFTHSTFSHRKGAPSSKKPKLDDMQLTTAEVRSATEDPAAADTSTATMIKTEKSHVNKRRKHQKEKIVNKISKDTMKEESTTYAATQLSGTKTDDKITCATEKQSECFNSTVIGTADDIPTCDICGYTTATMKNLNSHLIAHAAAKRYSCDLCLYITVSLGNFNNHLSTHTSDRPYACDKCDKKFRKKCILDAHMRIHTNERPFSCDLCDKKFYRKCDVVTHVISHSNERPYSCDVCGKKFRRKYNLVEHRGIHTGEKRYSCDMCDKKFNWKSDLVAHVKIHTGEKPLMPYSCDVCGKEFNRKRLLVEHVRTHTGEKPHSCDMCDKKYNRKGDLVAHVKTHMGVKPLMRYSCDLCQRRFSKIYNLKRHVSRHR